jgi:hypothetical protein
MGEIHLLETILESKNPHDLLKRALEEGFEFRRLEDYPVMKDGEWVSTQKSTVSCPVMYFEKGINHWVIVKRPQDEKYKLSAYTILL